MIKFIIVISRNYCSNDEIKEDEIGKARSTHRKHEKCILKFNPET
jgi:hypothetical protein